MGSGCALKRLWEPADSLPRHFVPHFPHSVASRSRPSGGFPKVGSSERRNPQEPQMITAYVAFVTVAFFVAIVANVAATVTTAGAMA